jgi:hypothetical protein
MPARSKSAAAKDSSANLGVEATGTRDSAFPDCEAIVRSLKGNRWLTPDSRSAPETAEGNRSKHEDVRWQFGVPPCSRQFPTVKWND